MQDSGLPEWVEAILTAVGVLGAVAVLWGIHQLFLLPGRLRFRRRVRAVEKAAAGHPYFDAGEVRRSAEALFGTLYESWNAGDYARLRQISSDGLYQSWLELLSQDNRAGGRYRVKVVRGPKLDYVGFGDEPGEETDYVRVRVRAKLKQWIETPDGRKFPLPHAKGSLKIDLHDYWTLSRRNDEWFLWSIRGRTVGESEFLVEPVRPPEARVALPR